MKMRAAVAKESAALIGSRRRLALLLFFAALVVVALSLLAQGLGRAPRTLAGPGARAAGESTGGSERTERLEDEVRLLKRQVAALSRSTPAPAAAPEKRSESAPAVPEETATTQELEQRSLDRFDLIESTLAAEPVDRAWSTETHRQVETVVKQPAFKGTRVVSSSCRSTLCRIEALHDSRAARTRFRELLPTRLPSLPTGTIRLGENGDRELKTIIYFARDGHQIPRLQP